MSSTIDHWTFELDISCPAVHIIGSKKRNMIVKRFTIGNWAKPWNQIPLSIVFADSNVSTTNEAIPLQVLGEGGGQNVRDEDNSDVPVEHEFHETCFKSDSGLRKASSLSYNNNLSIYSSIWHVINHNWLDRFQELTQIMLFGLIHSITSLNWLFKVYSIVQLCLNMFLPSKLCPVFNVVSLDQYSIESGQWTRWFCQSSSTYGRENR